MEPGARPAEEVTEQHDEQRARTMLRIAAGCMLLIGIAFIQSPGFLIADTKFDLAVDPIGFLGRATHLWDDQGAFGQLQNQAYGYLWPMGPFFSLGHLLDLPGWVVQRLWLALVMCVAFVGTARLARALGVRSDVACLVAAFAYATSPRMLTTIGPISIEAWPSALAPWVLLPLVIGATRGSPRRMALLSALAIAMVGGVNAAATFAVIPLGAIWLLTRTRGPRRRRLMLWWPLFTLLGTLWWLVPLFVMGAYSPPFLDFIETASVTTFPTTLFDALRGTSDWVPYVDPSWQGGRETITQSYLALNSGIVLMLGLVGLMQRGNPHRQFLLLSVALWTLPGDDGTPRRRRGLVRGATQQAARRSARAVPQRAQVRPGHPAADGARDGVADRGGSAGTRHQRRRHRRPVAALAHPLPGRRTRPARCDRRQHPRSRRQAGADGSGARDPGVLGGDRRLAGGQLRRVRWPCSHRDPASGTTCGALPATSRCSGWRTRAGRSATPSR